MDQAKAYPAFCGPVWLTRWLWNSYQQKSEAYHYHSPIYLQLIFWRCSLQPEINTESTKQVVLDQPVLHEFGQFLFKAIWVRGYHCVTTYGNKFLKLIIYSLLLLILSLPVSFSLSVLRDGEKCLFVFFLHAMHGFIFLMYTMKWYISEKTDEHTCFSINNWMN